MIVFFYRRFFNCFWNQFVFSACCFFCFFFNLEPAHFIWKVTFCLFSPCQQLDETKRTLTRTPDVFRIHCVLDVSHRNLIPLLSLSTWQCAIAMSRSHYLCSSAFTALLRSLPLQRVEIKRKRFRLLLLIQNTSPMTPKWPHSTDIQTACTDCFVYLHQYSYTFVGLPAL